MTQRFSDISALLDAEKHAILAGEFGALEDFARQKIELLQNSTEGRAAIREKLSRNSHLLDAASRGVRTALERLKALDDARQLSTYAQDGTLCREQKNTTRLERKA